MKFNSQICTSREQSERLLALGLKKETADMALFEYIDFDIENNCNYKTGEYEAITAKYAENIIFENSDLIPAWSLGRLLEILPYRVYESLWVIKGEEFDNILDLNLDFDFGLWYKGSERNRYFFNCIDLYDSAVQAIEWLIKEGYFNKEYLV